MGGPGDVATRAATEQLRVAVSASGMGRWDYDTASGLVVWDEAHSRLFGLTPGSFDGTLAGVMARIHPEDRDRVAGALAASVQAGTPFHGTFRVLLDDGTTRSILSHGRMLRRRGDPPVMSGVAIDATHTVHAAERATRLFEATAAMAAAHAPGDVARALDRAVRHSLASAEVRTTLLGALDVSQQRLELVEDLASGGSDCHEAAAETSGGSLPLRRVTPLTEAARTGRPVRAVSTAELYGRFPEVSEGLLAAGTSGVLALPLLVRERVIGAMAVHFVGPVQLSAGDEQFLRTVASQCAQALDRALLVEHEHQVAETLQRHLLPDRLPEVPGVSSAARYLPGTHGLHVGGDWYDLIDHGDGTIGLVIGDVVGKGLPAAMLMAQIRHGMRALLTVDPDPTAVLSACDRLAARVLDDSGIVTVFYARLHLATGDLSYISAGHPPPLVVPDRGSCTFLPVNPQPPLGAASPGHPRPTQQAVLDTGSMLLLYTDGLIEHRGGDLDAGLDLLRATAQLRRHSPHLIQGLLSRLLGPSRGDDVAVLTLRRDPPPTVKAKNT